MNIKKIVGINILNIFLFVLILLLKNLYPFPVIIGLGIVWLGFLLYTNYYFIIKNDDKVYELEKSNKGRDAEFEKIINVTAELTESIESKNEFFGKMEPDNRMRETYELVKNKFYINVEHMSEYMENFDYITNPVGQRKRIRDLDRENRELVGKLNDFVEQIISLEQSVEKVDTTIVDDLINSLRKIEVENG